MKKISEDQFFAPYPHYKNFNELKQADILIMPLHDRRAFRGAQRDFHSLVSDPSLNCLFFTEEKNRTPFYAEFSAPPIDLILQYGPVVITSLAGLIKIYEFLKEKSQGHRFKIKHIIAINQDYYEMDEFEGNIEDYKAVHQEIKSPFEK
jgi:hypothetical protein